MDHGTRVNLDAEPSAIQRLSLAGLATVAEGTSPSAAAAREALAAYEQGIADGKSEKDAATIARRVLLSALKG